jgi:hypothetical protein
VVGVCNLPSWNQSLVVCLEVRFLFFKIILTILELTWFYMNLGYFVCFCLERHWYFGGSYTVYRLLG